MQECFSSRVCLIRLWLWSSYPLLLFSIYPALFAVFTCCILSDTVIKAFLIRVCLLTGWLNHMATMESQFLHQTWDAMSITNAAARVLIAATEISVSSLAWFHCQTHTKGNLQTLRAQPWRWLMDSAKRAVVRGEQVTSGIFLSRYELISYQIKKEQTVHLLLRCSPSVAVSNRS